MYSGDSAGALIAGLSIAGIESVDEPEFAEEIIETGLSLVPFVILPHVDNPNFAALLPIFKRVHHGKEVIELKDAQTAVFKGKKHWLTEANPEITSQSLMGRSHYAVVKHSEGSIRRITPFKHANNLITQEISPAVSLATTTSTNPEYYEKEVTPYDRIYYILNGSLTLVVDGKTTLLEKGDACFIRKNTTYEMSGKFEAITVNQPAFGT